MADITVIASTAEIADLAREIAAADSDVAVVEARVAAGVAAALPDVSQVEITPSGFDLLRAFREATRHPGPVTVVDYPAVLGGTGSVDVRGLACRLDDGGYDGFMVLEFPGGDDPRGRVKKQPRLLGRLRLLTGRSRRG